MQDDLGLAYWLGTDWFTGFFLNKMDTQQNNTMQERYLSDNLMQHNATDEVLITRRSIPAHHYVLTRNPKPWTLNPKP